MIQKTALKYLVSIQSGHSPSTFDLAPKGRFPYVKVEDMNNCQKYQLESREYTDDSSRIVSKGAVIFPKRGAAIMNNKVRIAATDLCMDTNMMAIIPNSKVRGEYLYYVITYAQLFKIADTSTIPQINNKHIDPYKIALPSIQEQDQIVNVISTWDRAIEKTERLIQAKEKRFKGLLQTLINPADRSGWEKVHLKDVAKIRKGSQRNRDGLDDAGEYPAMNGGIGPSGYTDEWNTEANTVTISEGGNSCGFVNYVTHRFWCGGHCYALTNIRSEIENEYLFHFLKHHEPALMRLRVGSGLPNIQKKDVDDFPVEFPPLEEQKRITETLNLAQREIDLLKKLTEKQKLQKRGLMQKLLTGEWRVGKEGEAGLARTEGKG